MVETTIMVSFGDATRTNASQSRAVCADEAKHSADTCMAVKIKRLYVTQINAFVLLCSVSMRFAVCIFMW